MDYYYIYYKNICTDDEMKYTYSCINFNLIEGAQGIIIQASIQQDYTRSVDAKQIHAAAWNNLGNYWKSVLKKYSSGNFIEDQQKQQLVVLKEGCFTSSML